jgi:predicted enzyme related to lactoylglutathione lyase
LRVHGTRECGWRAIESARLPRPFSVPSEFVTPPFLIELPADDPERARRFWEELLGTALEPRRPDQGQGWQAVHSGVTVGVHERGSGPGDRFALPYFAVPDLPAALELVRSLGGEVVHPGERWAICRDSEGTPFGLGGPAPL